MSHSYLFVCVFVFAHLLTEKHGTATEVQVATLATKTNEAEALAAFYGATMVVGIRGTACLSYEIADLTIDDMFEASRCRSSVTCGGPCAKTTLCVRTQSDAKGGGGSVHRGVYNDARSVWRAVVEGCKAKHNPSITRCAQAR